MYEVVVVVLCCIHTYDEIQDVYRLRTEWKTQHTETKTKYGVGGKDCSQRSVCKSLHDSVYYICMEKRFQFITWKSVSRGNITQEEIILYTAFIFHEPCLLLFLFLILFLLLSAGDGLLYDTYDIILQLTDEATGSTRKCTPTYHAILIYNTAAARMIRVHKWSAIISYRKHRQHR